MVKSGPDGKESTSTRLRPRKTIVPRPLCSRYVVIDHVVEWGLHKAIKIQWSRGLDRDLRKRKKFGKNAHFVLTVHGQNGNQTTKIDHLDRIFATGDSTSRKKRPNLVRVVRLPCSMVPIPIKEVEVTLKQECPKAIKSVRSLWGGLINGGCDEMAVNIRRIKVRQLAPDTYRDNLRLLEKRDKGKMAILRAKIPRRLP